MNKNRKNIVRLLLVCVCAVLAITIQAQSTQNVKGSIVDNQGQPLTGVTVVIQGTTTGTITDANGLFSIASKTGDVLEVSYLGFNTQKIKVGNQHQLNITLTDDTKALDEVVVVGYGTQKKSDLTSSISSVKAADLMKTANTSLDQGLQGRAAGVVVLNTSGQPGAATSIRIRGTSSINGNNEPLYVIDGVPVISDPGSMSAGGLQTPATNPMSNINPNDIASIEILKDASATSIYGARGANGVVLVTTKRGKTGSAKISITSSITMQQVSNKMNMLDASQLATLGNEAADNAGDPRNPVYAPINNIAKGPNTNWQNEIFRVAPMEKFNVGLSGGNEKNTYFVSVGLLSQDGIIIGSNYKNGNVRLNFDQQFNKKLKLGISNNMSFSRSNGVVTNSEGAMPSSITSWALAMNPALPVKDDNGNYIYENNTSKTSNVGNPVQDALENVNRTTTFTTLTSAYIEYNPIKSLTLKSSFGVNYFNAKDQAFTGPQLKRAESNNGAASIANRDGYSWVWENTANYNITHGKHSINALVGVTSQAYVTESSWVATSDFTDGSLSYNSIQSGTEKQLAVSGAMGWQMQSYLARVNYGYDSKYLLTLTGRIDGSSKFAAGNKYGTFPSMAVAWRASQEDFLKNNKTISNLKFRFSYGLVGNEGIPAYSSQGLLYNTQAYFGDAVIVNGLVPYSLTNNKLKWETTAQTNLGVDIGFFKNRLSFTADIYSKKTSDLLLNVPVILNSGYDNAMLNVGDLTNKGVELTMNAIVMDNNKFTWSSDITYGLNRNMVTNLAGAGDDLNGTSILGITYWTKITKGMPIGTIYGYQTDGIVQQGEDLSKVPYFEGKTIHAGDRKYKDTNKDGKLNESDLVVLGNANPDFTYGFNNTFTYKLANKSSLAMTVYLQGVHGNKIANFNTFSLESFDGFSNNSTAALNRWTPTNPSNEYPRATTRSSGNIFSDHQVEDGSYLRVKNVTLAYNFAPALLGRYGIAGLNVYVSLQNLMTFTKYSGYDPEVSRFANNNLSMGADYGAYPMSKMYEMGLKLNF